MQRPFYFVFCTNCGSAKSNVRPVRLLRFFFDHEGALHIEGVCDRCLVRVSIEHSAEEISEDVRVMLAIWQEEQAQLTEDEVNRFSQGLDQSGIWDELDSDEDGP